MGGGLMACLCGLTAVAVPPALSGAAGWFGLFVALNGGMEVAQLAKVKKARCVSGADKPFTEAPVALKTHAAHETHETLME